MPLLHFPANQSMLRRNDCNILFNLQLLKLYSYVVIANVLISWLIAFNILNTSNRFVYSILEFTYRLTDPFLNRIRRFLPNLGAFDISPIILLLLIWFIEMCMKLYIAPLIF